MLIEVRSQNSSRSDHVPMPDTARQTDKAVYLKFLSQQCKRVIHCKKPCYSLIPAHFLNGNNAGNLEKGQVDFVEIIKGFLIMIDQ